MKNITTVIFIIFLPYTYLFAQVDKQDIIICYIPPSPSFVGGIDSMYSFLRKNLTYPKPDDVEEDGLLNRPYNRETILK